MIYFKLVLTAFFWAAVFHLGKYAITYISPLSAAAWRFLLATVFLLPYFLWQSRPDIAALRRNLWPLLAMGVIGVFGFNAALFYGLRLTSPINGALIMAFNPATTALLAAMITGEKISVRQRTGFVISLVGVIVIISRGSLQHLLTLDVSTGDLLIFLANLCWATYTVIPRRFINGLPSMTITIATIAIGAAILTVTAQSVSGDMLMVHTWKLAASLIAIALFGAALAYIWWNQGILQIGSGRVSIFINLVPMFTVLIGVVLGQMPSAAQWLGALLVICGVIVTVYNRDAMRAGSNAVARDGR